MVAHILCNGLLCGCVGARVGLCESEGSELFALGHGHKVFLLLLVVAEVVYRSTAERYVCGHYNARRCANLGELLDRYGIGDIIAACAAELLGIRNAQYAELCHLLNGLTREALRLVHLRRKRLYLSLGETADRSASHFLLLRKFKVHLYITSIKNLVLFSAQCRPAQNHNNTKKLTNKAFTAASAIPICKKAG